MKAFTFERLAARDGCGERRGRAPGRDVSCWWDDARRSDEGRRADTRHRCGCSASRPLEHRRVGSMRSPSARPSPTVSWRGTRSCVTASPCCRKRSSRAPPHRSATWRRSPATSCSGRAAPISETCTRRATADSRDPAAMRWMASTAATRCWASATTASPRIHPTCAWPWLFSMPRFTRCGPMAPRVRSRSAEFHKAPGDTPHVEVALAHGELITHVVIPHLAAAGARTISR